jgi:hypothetical protein
MASHALPRRAGAAPRLPPRRNLLAARAAHRKGIRVKFLNRGRDRSALNTRRQGASRLGAALAADLEAFGRFSYDPQGSPRPGDLEARMYALYQTDVEAFLTALAAAASGHGGWVAYGVDRRRGSAASGLRPRHGAGADRLTGERRAEQPSVELRAVVVAQARRSRPLLAGPPSWRLLRPTPGSPRSVRRRGAVAQMTANLAGKILLTTEGEAPEPQRGASAPGHSQAGQPTNSAHKLSRQARRAPRG